jgi:putative selenate reductase
MRRLTPIAFPDLLRRMKREVEICQAIFDLPARNWFSPAGECDFSARHFSHRASAPVGPAAGPQTQLAQNIVLSWLAGARILELKTVQENDRLEIPRPCIHIPNVGYNIEWSQELAVPESLLEYAKAIYLIEILKYTSAFGAFPSDIQTSSDAVFDISVGYDLQGIRSEKVTWFLRSIQQPARYFDELRRELSADYRQFLDLKLPPAISDCVTLSTFHGCPAHQIEAMVRYLLEELRLNVIVKFNPTLLGYETACQILIDRLGYSHLKLCPEAFERDLQYEEALEIMQRLNSVARECGLGVGAKFTNTLIVANNPAFFPTQPDPYMYLSGQPLHVMAMNLMQRFREDLGFEIPVSFSAGIDHQNFPAAVACGMVPVTTCTDLLRQGGYARLPRYLGSLAEEMRRSKVTTRENYVLSSWGHGAEAVRQALLSTNGGLQIWEREGARLTAIAKERPDELSRALRETALLAGFDSEAILLQATRIAGRLNGREIVPRLASEPRYHARSNQKEPHHINRELGLYDCINCDLCVSACPNDAIFVYEAVPCEAPTERLRLVPGKPLMRAPGEGYVIRKAHQLAIVETLCNECSNCEVYCPQQGAPDKLKEHVFIALEDFWAAAPREGFCRRDNVLYARLGSTEWIFSPNPEGTHATVRGDGFRLIVQLDPLEIQEVSRSGSEELIFDSSLLWRMKTVWESIFESTKPNAVNPDPVIHGNAKPRQYTASVEGHT